MAVSTLQPRAGGRLAVPRPQVRFGVLAVGAFVSLVTAIVGVEYLNAQAAAAMDYRAAAVRLQGAITQAEASGYSPEDLAPALGTAKNDTGVTTPLFLQQNATYRRREAELNRVLADLPRVEATALAGHHALVTAEVAAAGDAITAAGTQGADGDATATLRSRLDAVRVSLVAAASPRTVDKLASAAGAVRQDATAVGAAAAAEQAQLQQAAEALKAQFGGNLDQVRSAGNAAVGPARNDATVATLLKLGGVQKLAHRVDHYAALVTSPDLDLVALGAAGAQSLQGKLHSMLVSGMPQRTIVVSLAAQELWAYESGKVVQDSLVTTGRPELPTDVGAMKVLSKDSPWKMHSPWPKGNPHWYPDTTVQHVVWFTATGEGLHDASWEPLSYYGPGGQNSAAASHGCVHLPNAANDFIYNWAQPGTSVIVIPGDGTPLNDQMSKVSVDPAGVPFTGPKGS